MAFFYLYVYSAGYKLIISTFCLFKRYWECHPIVVIDFNVYEPVFFFPFSSTGKFRIICEITYDVYNRKF